MLNITKLPLTQATSERIRKWLGGDGAADFMQWLVTLDAVLTAEAGNLLLDAAAEPSKVDEARAKANEAAATLVDPLARGQALLELFAPVPRPNDARPQPAFLMQMMSLREAIDGGDVGVQDELEALRMQAEDDAERLFGRLVGGDSSAWPEAGEALGRLRAVRRAREALQQ